MKKKNKQQKEKITEKVGKKVKEKENRQLKWLFFWIIVVFAAFLIPYFYIQANKHFSYNNIEWFIEDYGGLKIYHGQFLAFNDNTTTYNIFLRNDPRTNDVPIEGNYSYFKYGGYISISPEVDECRGELPRALTDLAAFTQRGVGVAKINVATNDLKTASELGRTFVNCSTNLDRTVIILEMGFPGVIQDEKNNVCYTITIENCNDIKPLEKFMARAVLDFKDRYN
jgi:hypothetical protein